MKKKSKWIDAVLLLIVLGAGLYIANLHFDWLGHWHEKDIVATERAEEDPLQSKLKAWQGQSQDVQGWLSIQDTYIDLPVVQGKDNTFYLNHDATGKYNPNGAAFIDYEIKPLDQDPDHIVIYAHNMANHEVFSDIESYFKQKGYFENHSDIKLATSKGIHTYKVRLAVYMDIQNAQSFFPFHTWLTWHGDENAKTYMDAMAKRAVHQNLSSPIKKHAHLLTLSTCDNAAADARYILVAEEIT